MKVEIVKVKVPTMLELDDALRMLIAKGICNIRTEQTSDNQYEVAYEVSADSIPASASKITCDEYQRLSRRTQSKCLSERGKRSHALFGLASEVGEIMSLFQHEYQGKPAEKNKVLDECGDVCWFLCELLDTYSIDFSTVLQYNVDKLKKRYPEGFDPVRSDKRHEME